MEVLIAVLKDLWQFVFARRTPLLGLPPAIPHTEPALAEKKGISQPPKEEALSTQSFTDLYSTVYIQEDQTPYFLRPVLAFDSVLSLLAYGTAVLLVRYEGRFAQVQVAEKTGWVLKDALSLKKEDVYPLFTIDALYDAYAPDTIKVRALLRDEFFASSLRLPLQPGEYVSFKWRVAHRYLPWGDRRPRVPGSWQQLLRGASGVFFSITPKTGAIMEYVDAEGMGQLAYVEAVYPNGSVFLSGVSGDGEGRYFEQTLKSEEWKEFRPVWITLA